MYTRYVRIRKDHEKVFCSNSDIRRTHTHNEYELVALGLAPQSAFSSSSHSILIYLPVY